MSESREDEQTESESEDFITISGHTVVKGPKSFSKKEDKDNTQKDE